MIVSIITIAKNPNLEYFKRAIYSVKASKSDYIEHIVVDASDISVAIKLESMCLEYGIMYKRQKTQGLWAAFSEGFGYAKGDICGIINCDDYFEEGAIADVRRVFKNREVDFVFGLSRRVDVNENSLYMHRPPKELLPFMARFLTFTVSHHTLFFRRDILKNISFLDSRFTNHYDLVFIVNLFENCRYYYLNRVIANFRVTGENASIDSYNSTAAVFATLNKCNPRFYYVAKFITMCLQPSYLWYLLRRKLF